ncbi:MAG: hypothetical protein J0I50_02130 [Microbacterium sp.]|nr:hypothetical protein [Microbacterium sp.]
MGRSLGGLAIVVCAVILTACASGGGTSPTKSATSPASPTPAATLDGDWIAQVADSASPCIGIAQRIVHIEGGTASTTPSIAGAAADAPALTGPATLAGEAVTIHVARSSPTKDALDVTATLDAEGVVHGTATAGGVHPGGTNGYACDFAITLIRAVGGADMPPFDAIAGTWCEAAKPTTCLTIASGRVAFGDDAPAANLDPPRTDGFGPPCYVTAAIPDQPGGGFTIYFCPKGVVIEPGRGGVDGDIVAPHDNVAFDRIYGTQNPPYLQVYFRTTELTAATAP